MVLMSIRRECNIYVLSITSRVKIHKTPINTQTTIWPSRRALTEIVVYTCIRPITGENDVLLGEKKNINKNESVTFG